jgi:integrase
MQEGLIRSNPTAGASLPARDATRAAEAGEDEEPDRRALSRRELADLLTVAPERYRTLFQLLASTGLRISEALALRWRDLSLDGSRPVVRVRRAYVKGRYAPPKSKHGRRSVPLDHALVRELRKARSGTDWPSDDDLVFCSRDGRPLHDRNLSARVLKPAAEEAGASWAGWHTLRHTCASLLFARGANAVQVQRWLGHHSPGFTLATYVHLLDDDLGAPLDLATETGQGGNKVATRDPATARNAEATITAEVAG